MHASNTSNEVSANSGKQVPESILLVFKKLLDSCLISREESLPVLASDSFLVTSCSMFLYWASLGGLEVLQELLMGFELWCFL